MVTPKRIQRKRTKGWRMPEGAVYVGRPSRWGNPFRIYNGHTSVGPTWSVARGTWKHIPADQCIYAYVSTGGHLGNEEAVGLFRTLLTVRQRDEAARLQEWLAPLVGRDLACWCALDAPCHADVLLEIANGGESGE